MVDLLPILVLALNVHEGLILMIGATAAHTNVDIQQSVCSARACHSGKTDRCVGLNVVLFYGTFDLKIRRSLYSIVSQARSCFRVYWSLYLRLLAREVVQRVQNSRAARTKICESPVVDSRYPECKTFRDPEFDDHLAVLMFLVGLSGIRPFCLKSGKQKSHDRVVRREDSHDRSLRTTTTRHGHIFDRDLLDEVWVHIARRRCCRNKPKGSEYCNEGSEVIHGENFDLYSRQKDS